MSKPKIELITCESGDWKVLRVKTDNDNTEYSGHDISDFVWMEIMRDYLGCDIERRCISDEDMEMGRL